MFLACPRLACSSLPQRSLLQLLGMLSQWKFCADVTLFHESSSAEVVYCIPEPSDWSAWFHPASQSNFLCFSVENLLYACWIVEQIVFSFPYKLMISVQNGLADWYLMKLYGNRYQLYQWSTAWVDQEWKQLSLDWIILGISIQSALYYLLLENRLNSWFLKF